MIKNFEKTIPGWALLFFALVLLGISAFLKSNGDRLGAEAVWWFSAMSLVIGTIIILVHMLMTIWPLIAFLLFMYVMLVGG